MDTGQSIQAPWNLDRVEAITERLKAAQAADRSPRHVDRKLG
jgi:hypothetical protein